MQVALELDSTLSTKNCHWFWKKDTYTLDQRYKKTFLRIFFAIFWIPNNFSFLFKRFGNRIYVIFGPERLGPTISKSKKTTKSRQSQIRTWLYTRNLQQYNMCDHTIWFYNFYMFSRCFQPKTLIPYRYGANTRNKYDLCYYLHRFLILSACLGRIV